MPVALPLAAGALLILEGIAMRVHRQGSGGFTLLELIIVITIIGLLATMVTIKVAFLPGKARVETARSNLVTIVEAANMIYTMTGQWPLTLDDLRRSKGKDGEPMPSIQGIRKDPWGNPYIYEVGDDGPVARSLGRDKREGGEGEDADLIWPPPEDS
jgi:general secretion pathway protein G